MKKNENIYISTVCKAKDTRKVVTLDMNDPNCESELELFEQEQSLKRERSAQSRAKFYLFFKERYENIRENIQLNTPTANDCDLLLLEIKSEIEALTELLEARTQVDRYTSKYEKILKSLTDYVFRIEQKKIILENQPIIKSAHIDTETLKTYFKGTFKGIGRDINYFPFLTDRLNNENYNHKEFAMIALMIFESKHYTKSHIEFRKWYETFCQCCDREHKSYHKGKLKPFSERVERLFNFL